MRAHIRDTAIYFDVEGMGLVPDGPRMREKPVAFVLHGGPGGDHSSYKPSLAPLAERMQLVYVDHRGQGRSAPEVPERMNLDENVEDLEALRRHLGLEQVVVIGTSYGGMVAQAYGARYPASVSHLVLIVTASHAGFNARARQIVAERGTAEQRRVCDQLWAGELDDVAKLRHYYDQMGPMYAVSFDAEKAALGRSRGILTPAALNEAFRPGGFLQTFDLRPELGRITAPTLVVAGRHDWICAPEFSEEIHRLIPGSDLRIFEHSSHSVRGDETAALLDLIAGFIVYNSRAGG